MADSRSAVHTAQCWRQREGITRGKLTLNEQLIGLLEFLLHYETLIDDVKEWWMAELRKGSMNSEIGCGHDKPQGPHPRRHEGYVGCSARANMKVWA